MNKLKKILIGIGIGIMSLPSKILATAFNMNEMQDLYGIPQPTLYGVPNFKPSKMEVLVSILKLLAIPLILLIGLIIYIKKAQKSKKKKIIILLWIIAIVALIITICKYNYIF